MTAKPDIPVTFLRTSRGWAALNLSDLWRYRELIYFMTWRDLKVRYKQTVLGAGWAILRPFMTMVVFSIFFGGLAKVPSNGVPYPIFSFTGLLPWELFVTALNVSSRSLVVNSNMITKIYFPRVILPLSSILAGLVDFAIAFVVLLFMMFYYGMRPSPNVWSLPFFLLLALVTSFGVGLWLAALNVLYRDIAYITPFLAQFWLFITPIAYPASLVPLEWQFLYSLNPMAGVVEGFRWALLGSTQPAPTWTVAISGSVALILLITGIFFFRRMERQFADMI
jgi:lipopolysaccharide transport system permease protein